MGGWRNPQRCVDRLAGAMIGGAKPRSYIDEDVKANWNDLEEALQTVGAANVPATLPEHEERGTAKVFAGTAEL